VSYIKYLKELNATAENGTANQNQNIFYVFPVILFICNFGSAITKIIYSFSNIIYSGVDYYLVVSR